MEQGVAKAKEPGISKEEWVQLSSEATWVIHELDQMYRKSLYSIIDSVEMINDVMRSGVDPEKLAEAWAVLLEELERVRFQTVLRDLSHRIALNEEIYGDSNDSGAIDGDDGVPFLEGIDKED